MNIPLNISWVQILLHLFNFSILAGGLYFLLWSPVKRFMEKRSEHYQQMDEQAEEKLKKANEMEASYQQHMAEMDTVISQKRAAAEQAAEAEASETLHKAKQQADKMLADAREAAQQERDTIVASAGQQIAELAAAAAEKLVASSVDETYGQFLNAARKDETHGKQ